jgi:peptidoglycan hydrolase-like protein with peptidoglycan-binding domain
MMLMGLAKANMLKGDFKRLVGSLGYDGSKKSFDPKRFTPPTKNTQDFMQKWLQVALNVVLGINLSIDGKIGAITRQAIKRLQRQEGLTAHGYIDDRTLQVLELRTGVQAPRQMGHEAVPHLLRHPKRGIWKKEAKSAKGKKRATERGAGDKAAGPQGAAKDAVDPATSGILQTEAMDTVAEIAFDSDFVSETATELNRKDPAALRKEMDSWLRQAESAPDERPDWLQRAHDLARAHAESSASILRQQWWAAMEDDA